MKRVDVAPFSLPPEHLPLINVILPYGRRIEFEWTSPVSLSRPIVVLRGHVGVGYLDQELELRPTYLLVPGAPAMPYGVNDQYAGREPILPLGAEVLEMDTAIRWPLEVEAAFGRLLGLELKRANEYLLWQRTRNREERVDDLYKVVGALNAKQLASLANIPVKVIRQRFKKYLRAGGRVSKDRMRFPDEGVGD